MNRDSKRPRGCCGCLGLLVVIVATSLVAAWFLVGEPAAPADEAPPAPTETATPAGLTPVGATWTITSDAVRDITNYRFVDVVLSQRVSEPDLTAIAQRIRQQSPDHPVVHILYWIEGMDSDRGAWSTTRFEHGQPVNVRINDHLLTPTATPQSTPTSQPTAAPRLTPTPTVQVTYSTCDDVPTYLLRLDTQGRIAVEGRFVPSQPDGDGDGFACGDQLEHKRGLVRSTPAPTATTTRAPQACDAFERTYLRVLEQNIQAIGAGALLLVDLFQRLEQNPSLLQDLDFRTEFAIIGGRMNGVGKEILDRPRPLSPRLALIHDRARTMARSLKAGLDGMMDGISRVDSATIITGSDQVEAAGREIRAIRHMAEGVCA